MTFRDFRGLEVTASTQATVDELDRFSLALMGFSNQAMGHAEAAAKDSDCALAQAFAGMAWLSSDTAIGRNAARAYLDRALALKPGATDREQQIIAASRHWLEGNLRKAAATLDELLTKFPEDVTAAKVCQGMYFDLGDAPGILRAPMKVAEACSDLAYTHGMLAFGYEECNLLDEAEAAALKAVAMKRKEPWAHHAFAHVCEGRNACEKGAEFMAEMSDTWSGLTSFMYTHNWWHLCLFYIDLDRLDDALAMFDKHVWGIDKSCVQDQIGAISLLYRLQRVGVDVGSRWADVAGHVLPRAADQISAFLDLQYVYALARVGDPEAERMVERIHRRAEGAAPHEQMAWQMVADVAAPAIVALAQGRPERACSRLAQIFPYLSEIGGSHAQRDLMHLFYLDALLASGQFDRAHGLLETRRLGRPRTGWIRRALEKVYTALDLPQVAARYGGAGV